MDIVAIDWSGARVGAAERIWLAHVRPNRPDQLAELRNGRSRSDVIDLVCQLPTRCPEGLVVGLDFAFSYPAWFLRHQGHDTVGDLWSCVAESGEHWLAECPWPYWGRPGIGRPDLPEHFRLAERNAAIGGIGPKSVFQIGGAGAVGTGSIRGMPFLRQLRAAGFSIWPFDPPSRWTVVEIYPRLMTGPVHKKNQVDRARYLERSAWAELPERGTMERSEDAFDAAISALVMAQADTQWPELIQSTDPIMLLEGDIWRPREATTRSPDAGF
ncbi:MAG TPA: hypothetical protein VHV57_12345 [Acidimicrobiales bacterium]|jgi:hypothetical protein|nr:hypothetical protein [Acidimicrobiales bacterium]